MKTVIVFAYNANYVRSEAFDELTEALKQAGDHVERAILVPVRCSDPAEVSVVTIASHRPHTINPQPEP